MEGLSGILGPDGLMYLQHITLRAFLALLHDRITYSAEGCARVACAREWLLAQVWGV